MTRQELLVEQYEDALFALKKGCAVMTFLYMKLKKGVLRYSLFSNSI